MSMTDTLIALAALTFSAIVACLRYLPWRASESAGRHSISAIAPTPLDTTPRVPGYHDAPLHAMSGYEAHATLQEHLNCNAGDCRRKGAAFDTLVAAGRIKPAVRYLR